MRSLVLRSGHSLTVLKMALSAGFNILVSFHVAALATRLLTFTSAGLTPAVQTNLRWTHQLRKYSRTIQKLKCNSFLVLHFVLE